MLEGNKSPSSIFLAFFFFLTYTRGIEVLFTTVNETAALPLLFYAPIMRKRATREEAMQTIPLTQGKTMKISDSDLEITSEHSWCFHANGYAKARINKQYVLFHRWILNAPNGVQVDHINGDKLDNRRENLRFCTQSQNNANTRLRNCNSSGYKGVDYREEKKKFRARLAERFLGYHETAELAAIAYNTAAKERFGEFALLNIIPQESL